MQLVLIRAESCMQPTDTRIWSYRRIAEHLGRDRQTVLSWLKSGKLPGCKIGGRWSAIPAEIERFRRADERHPAL